MEPLSLYIHIPFCRAKCLYCHFNSYSGLEALIPDYVQALIREEDLWASELIGYEVATIYLGGGTPSLLPPGQVKAILEAARTRFPVAQGAEVSLEANPGTLDLFYLQELKEAGVNRLSLGVQSLHNSHLKALGRLHTAAQARQAYRWAKKVGFDNVNLDLLYGLPGQSLRQWRGGLGQALSLGPEHLSLYCLALEGTPLAQAIKGEPDPDLAADMYALAEDLLEAAGYEHYEISNWAREGWRCRHNLTYWHNRPYLGLGAGAHSYLGGRRWANVPSPQEYIRRLAPGVASKGKPRPQMAWARSVGRRRELAETAILGLRLGEGLDLEALAHRFGLARAFPRKRRELIELGLAEEIGGRLRLTRRGRLLGNQAFLRFLP